jgi:hypothetical protein
MTLLNRINGSPPGTEAVGVGVGCCLSDWFEGKQVERLYRSVDHARYVKWPLLGAVRFWDVDAA